MQVTFASADANVAWELRADQKFVCRTPCQRWVGPGQPYELRTEAGPPYTTLPVPDLRRYVGEGHLRWSPTTGSRAASPPGSH